MALSGSFQKAISQYYDFRVDWTATQNVSQNQSTVTFKTYLVGHNLGSASTGIGARTGNAAKINGSSYTWDAVAVSKSGNFTLQLGSKTVTVTHNADGAKSFSASFTWNCKFTTAGSYHASVTASGTVTLNTIPRASSIALSPASQTIGEAIGITITRASSAFTHTLTYSFQGLTGTIASQTASTSLSWTIPTSFRSKFTTSASLTGSITLTTYSGQNAIGTAGASFTAKLSAEDYPVISSVTLTPVGSPAGFTSLYLQNKSKASVVIAASGATALTYRATIAGKSYSSASFTSDVLTTPGSLTLSVTVTDARGLSTAVTRTVTVLPYGPPYLIPSSGAKEVRVYRSDSSGNPVATGTYLAVRGGRSLYSLNGANTAGVTMQYKLASASSYSAAVSLSPVSGTQTVYFSRVFDYALSDRAYQIKLTVTDLAGSTQTVVFTLPQSMPTLDLRAGGLGAAFGKYAEADNLLDIAWGIKVGGNRQYAKGGCLVRERIPNGSDLDTFTDVGFYSAPGNAVAATLINSPTQKAFIMDVYNSTGSAESGPPPGGVGYRYYHQEITANDMHRWIRSITYTNSSTPVFSAWVQEF